MHCPLLVATSHMWLFQFKVQVHVKIQFPSHTSHISNTQINIWDSADTCTISIIAENCWKTLPWMLNTTGEKLHPCILVSLYCLQSRWSLSYQLASFSVLLLSFHFLKQLFQIPTSQFPPFLLVDGFSLAAQRKLRLQARTPLISCPYTYFCTFLYHLFSCLRDMSLFSLTNSIVQIFIGYLLCPRYNFYVLMVQPWTKQERIFLPLYSLPSSEKREITIKSNYFNIFEDYKSYRENKTWFEVLAGTEKWEEPKMKAFRD